MQLQRAGFSLIELVVGLAIMIMIATVVAPVMLGSLDRARVDQGAEALRNLTAALSSFEEDVMEWPATLEQLTRPIETSQVNSCGRSFQPGDVMQWDGPYVDRVITTDGLPVFVGTLQNQLVREPATQTAGGNYGYLKLVITGVSQPDAVALDEEIDGTHGPAAGSVQWSAASGGAVTVYYLIPAKGC